VLSGLQVPMLQHYARIVDARIVLPAATYRLTVAYARVHAPGVQFAAGKEGVVLQGEEFRYAGSADWVSMKSTATLAVQTKGVTFVSMDLPHGVMICRGGSLTMKKCTSTGGTASAIGGAYNIGVDSGCALVMEDSRVFSCPGDTSVRCEGQLKATRCIFEDNRDAVSVGADADHLREQCSGELVD